jgi:hypothetical protein
VPLTKHSQPTGRAPVAGAVLGIVFIALAVLVAAPVALNWPASWPGLLIVIASGSIGVALVMRHISRHRVGQINAEDSRNAS